MKKVIVIKDFPMRYAFPKTKCPICGSEDGCRYSHGYLKDSPLTKDDWRKVYEFMKYVELPFLHNIIARARRRAAEESK